LDFKTCHQFSYGLFARFPLLRTLGTLSLYWLGVSVTPPPSPRVFSPGPSPRYPISTSQKVTVMLDMLVTYSSFHTIFNASLHRKPLLSTHDPFFLQEFDMTKRKFSPPRRTSRSFPLYLESSERMAGYSSMVT